MQVDVEEIERVLRYFKTINEAPLEEIVWMRGDTLLTPTNDQIDGFKFIGLSNRDFPSVVGWMPDDIGIRVTTITLTKSA